MCAVRRMRTLYGYLYDGWLSLRFMAKEAGEAIDRAMDVWSDDD